MRRKINTLLALCAMWVAVAPGTVLAAEGDAGQPVEQEVVQQAESLLEALLQQGVPVEDAVKQVLQRYPEVADRVIANAVQIVSPGAGAAGDQQAVVRIVEAAREVLEPQQAESAIVQGLLLAGVDPTPFVAATAAGGPEQAGGEQAGTEQAGTEQAGTEQAGTEQAGAPGAAAGLPVGSPAGGGGGSVSPS